MYFDPQCKPNPVAQALLDAASLIEQRGWCQGTGEREGALCMLRAIGVAAPSDDILVAACETLGKLLNTRFGQVWNDVPGRTKEEVVAMLRRAAGSS